MVIASSRRIRRLGGANLDVGKALDQQQAEEGEECREHIHEEGRLGAQAVCLVDVARGSGGAVLARNDGRGNDG